jgi:hypothetical protein
MDDSDNALAIMRGWEWAGWSGFYGQEAFGPIPLSLSDAVNKLAFDGQPNAARVMLSLLASRKFVATGSYEWRG